MIILPSHPLGWPRQHKPKLAYIDLETYSPVPITYGSHRYAEGVEILICTYADGDGPPQLWDLTENPFMPPLLRRMLWDPDYLLVMHNGMGFDRVQFRHGMCLEIPYQRIVDSMAMALAHSLPGSLDKLCDILKVPQDQAKIKTGHALIHTFCVPHKKGRITKAEEPQKWEKFCQYALMDIVAMREVFKRLPRWNYKGYELDIFYLDAAINDRGVQLDIELCNAAIGQTNHEKIRLAREIQELTQRRVSSSTQRDVLLEYILSTYDLTIKDLTKSTVAKLLDDSEIPQGLCQLLINRQNATKTSTAKYQRFLDWVSSDGRLRGSLQYCGASRTGRWAGRGPQLHNLPKPTWNGKPMDEEMIEAGFCTELAERIIDDSIGEITPNTMEACSAAIRGVITAKPGRKLVVADLSAIEARVLAWVAGEEKILEAFRKLDRKEGVDEYKRTYSEMFFVPIEKVTKSQRQVGKVANLLLGYGGSVGAIVKGSVTFNIDLDRDIGAVVYPTLSSDVIEMAEIRWKAALTKENNREEKRKVLRSKIAKETDVKRKQILQRRLDKLFNAHYGLSRETFIACDGIKQLYRSANKNIVQLWWNLEEAVRSALNYPGIEYKVGHLRVIKKGDWTRIILPSGRSLCYPWMRIADESDIEEDDEEDEIVNNIIYLGVKPITKRWGWIRTYSGKLVENSDQAISRDILVHGARLANENGYPVCLSVHDELITEPLNLPEFNVQGLAGYMATVPDWAPGLPLAANGFEATRYRK